LRSHGWSLADLARETGISEAHWRKSSYSNDSGGDCVELASDSGVVMVRATKNRQGALLSFSAEAWAAFTAAL